MVPVFFSRLDQTIALLLAYVLRRPRFLFAKLAQWGDDPSTPTGIGAIVVFVSPFGGSFPLWGLFGLTLGLLVRLMARPRVS
jgi:hypothetical protein